MDSISNINLEIDFHLLKLKALTKLGRYQMHFSTIKSAYLKCIQVSHVEDENVDLHAPQTQRVVIVVPFGEIVNRELFLFVGNEREKRRSNKFRLHKSS